MLSAKAQLNLQNAREYFREHLCAGDYYSAGQKITGEWFGEGAEKFGLKGDVKESNFLRLTIFSQSAAKSAWLKPSTRSAA